MSEHETDTIAEDINATVSNTKQELNIIWMKVVLNNFLNLRPNHQMIPVTLNWHYILECLSSL